MSERTAPVPPASSLVPTTQEPSDEALLMKVVARDATALASLYDRHRAQAYAVALRITASVPAAEDALQDAFLGIWRQAAGFDSTHGSGRAWLLSIVRHRAIDHVRRRRRTEPLPEDQQALPAAFVSPDLWPEVAGNLDAEAVRAALTSLPDAQRECLELAYWGGLTQAQIASHTRAALGTVKGRMRLGLLALRHRLAGDQGAGPDAGSLGGVTSPAPSLDGRHPSARPVPSAADARLRIVRDALRLVRRLALRLAGRARGARPAWQAARAAMRRATLRPETAR